MLISGFTAVTNANVVQGNLFEFLRRPSRVSVAVVSDVVVNPGNVFTFQMGDLVVATAALVMPKTVNTVTSFIAGVVYPDDFLVQNEPGLANDRLVLSITRAAGNIMWAVQIIEVA